MDDQVDIYITVSGMYDHIFRPINLKLSKFSTVADLKSKLVELGYKYEEQTLRLGYDNLSDSRTLQSYGSYQYSLVVKKEPIDITYLAIIGISVLISYLIR